MTNGTPAGTMLLKDINAGTTSSLIYFQSLQRFVTLGSAAYFIAKSQTGLGIWKTDGTSAGTTIVEDFSTNANISGVDDLTPFNGKLYFTANLSTGGAQLWTSDGSSGGTQSVETFSVMADNLTVAGNTLFFSAYLSTNSSQEELYASDGTAAGTNLIPGAGSGQAGAWPVQLSDVGGTLYFVASDQAGVSELWRVDQSAQGTLSMEDIWQAASTAIQPNPSNLVGLDGTLFFKATDQAHGAEVWKLNLLQANAGGPYFATGSTVLLDASGSRDPNPNYPLTYSWDLDGDGIFGETGTAARMGDETGANPTFVNRARPGIWPVTVQVTGSWHNTATAIAYITVPTPPYFQATTAMFYFGTAAANTSIQFWTIDWGDQTPVETYVGYATAISHFYATASGTNPFMLKVSSTSASGSVATLPIPVTVYPDPVFNNGLLNLTGTSGNDVVTASNAGGFFDVGMNGALIDYYTWSISHFIYNDGGGDDQINLTDSASATLNLSSGNDSIVNSGTTAIVNPGIGKISVDVSSGGTITFPSSGRSGIRQIHLSSINISAGAKVVFANSSATLGDYSNHANRSVLVIDTGGLNITSGGTLDLGDNDLVLNYDPGTQASAKSLIAGLITSGYGVNKDFSGTGMTSSEANYDATQSGGTRAIGWGDDADLGKTSFDSVTLATTNEMLVKFTYYGDCNLDGTVDTGPDLSLFAKGFHGQGSGWDFGDFNYDGLTNNLDLSLFARGLNSGYKTFGAL